VAAQFSSRLLRSDKKIPEPNRTEYFQERMLLETPLRAADLTGFAAPLDQGKP
jgi:hypothetical protein